MRVLTKQGFYYPINNLALKQIGIMGLQVSAGASRIETLAVLAKLKTLKHQDFKSALLIQQRPHFNFVIDREKPFQHHLGLIRNQRIKAFTRRALEIAAPEFFLKPSSVTTAKFHPVDEFSIGGQVFHSARATELGVGLHRVLFPNEEVPDVFIAGLLLHDICSHIKIKANGDLVLIHTSKGHAPEGAKFLRALAQKEFPELLSELEPVFNMVFYHYGRWEDTVDTTLTPKNDFYDWFLSATDIITAFARSFIDYPGAPSFKDRAAVALSNIDGWFFERRVLPLSVRRSTLTAAQEKAVAMAKVFFVQYDIEPARQNRIIETICRMDNVLVRYTKDELVRHVDLFIVMVSLALQHVPTTVLDLTISLNDMGVKN